MILYFSATGNSQYVADRLASALGQDAVSLVDCLRRGETSFTDDTICVVSPTYFWGLPSIVKEFLAQADLHADYLCFLATYGTTPGASDRMAGKAIRGRAPSTPSTPSGCRTPGLPSSISPPPRR